VEEVTFQPTPAQAPGIPIWIGGGWPKKGIVQRAARYDGICPYKIHEEGAFTDMTPAEVQALKASIEGLRRTSTPFDIALGGRERGDDWERDRSTIRSLAGAGATWWIEYIPVGELEGMRASVKRGPLRVD
jgi:alkanesulfonate monooxygenase SsuD/methylene tetrahydromethanopterin reductase-like flavin-dependent oxidoreductase (luciferase family)